MVSFNKLLAKFTDLVTADNVTETPVLDKFTDAVLGGEVAEAEFEHQPQIYVFIDNRVLSEEQITQLKTKIIKAFNYTIYKMVYKITFFAEMEKCRTKPNNDIFVCLTDDIFSCVKHENIYVGGIGVHGETPGNSNYPIWVLIQQKINYDKIAYYTMHEVTHRVTSLAKWSYDINGIGDPLRHDDAAPNLIMSGELMEEYLKVGDIDVWADLGYFKLLEERRKFIIRYLTHLKKQSVFHFFIKK